MSLLRGKLGRVSGADVRAAEQVQVEGKRPATRGGPDAPAGQGEERRQEEPARKLQEEAEADLVSSEDRPERKGRSLYELRTRLEG